MELNICHLYPDLLNVYGDVGNILILKHRAELRGIKVNILNNSLNDAFDVDNYDIVLFGGGQDFEQSIVSNDLSGAKKDALEKYIEAGKDLEGKGFDPRKLLNPGFEAIKACVKEKMELFGSVNKA